MSSPLLFCRFSDKEYQHSHRLKVGVDLRIQDLYGSFAKLFWV